MLHASLGHVRRPVAPRHCFTPTASCACWPQLSSDVLALLQVIALPGLSLGKVHARQLAGTLRQDRSPSTDETTQERRDDQAHHDPEGCCGKAGQLLQQCRAASSAAGKQTRQGSEAADVCEHMRFVDLSGAFLTEDADRILSEPLRCDVLLP